MSRPDRGVLSKDNTTFRRKLRLRRLALRVLGQTPVVMETHGGYGRLWLECYRDVVDGVVFEVDGHKADTLAEQRPSWAVYQADCVTALAGGAGAHLAINLLDVDPYGEPWPVLDAFFASERPRPNRMVVVVNDGLRRNVRFGFAWHVGSLAPIVERYGNDLFDRYLEACEEIMQQKAAQAGYAVSRFSGYYCGEKKNMTHYLAILDRQGISANPA